MQGLIFLSLCIALSHSQTCDNCGFNGNGTVYLTHHSAYTEDGMRFIYWPEQQEIYSAMGYGKTASMLLKTGTSQYYATKEYNESFQINSHWKDLEWSNAGKYYYYDSYYSVDLEPYNWIVVGIVIRDDVPAIIYNDLHTSFQLASEISPYCELDDDSDYVPYTKCSKILNGHSDSEQDVESTSTSTTTISFDIDTGSFGSFISGLNKKLNSKLKENSGTKTISTLISDSLGSALTYAVFSPGTIAAILLPIIIIIVIIILVVICVKKGPTANLTRFLTRVNKPNSSNQSSVTVQSSNQQPAVAYSVNNGYVPNVAVIQTPIPNSEVWTSPNPYVHSAPPVQYTMSPQHQPEVKYAAASAPPSRQNPPPSTSDVIGIVADVADLSSQFCDAFISEGEDE